MRTLLPLLLLMSIVSYGQSDTITLVSYNLLNFPDGRDDCGTNIVVPNRADTLRKILQYAQPDIFVACEIQTEAGADSVLTRSLNVYGASNYASATFHSTSTLHNQLYYNTNKLILQWQDAITTSSRDIDHYVLYVNDPTLGVYFDTTFIEVYMCHLKAGNSTSNEAIRAEQTLLLMDYIATRPSDRNHFLCGDLNVYSSNEDGYQQMISGAFALEDPINTPGSWNNNGTYANIHTQSTRSSLNYDCGSKGGSDDRFDQILVSSNVMNGSDSLKYLTNSYDALGNDGNHYNTNLLASPVNTQYPDSVVKALYYMSDHLPVTLKTVVTYPTSNGLALYPVIESVSCFGFNDGEATIVPNDGQAPYTFLWDNAAGNQATATAINLSAGSYCVVVTDNLGEQDDYCVYVPEPTQLSYGTFLTPDSDNCNGVAHLVIQSTVEPYTVTWNDPQAQTGFSAYNLCAGTYEATVVDGNGCITVIEIIIQDNTIGLHELNQAGVTLFPNPTEQVLTIEFDVPQEFCTIEVLDAFGRVVMVSNHSSSITKLELDVHNLNSGYYFIQIEANNTRFMHRLIKN
ncbi:MAG: T9SS type A sorting domain-containing protein [Crocinitomicaceae bacterium]|nr:T9SS type A sorting domain-containing protein [Crocinitomicaceae bacterium]